MEIKRGGPPSGRGGAGWFTGMVRIASLFAAADPARVAGARAAGTSVTFEPGVRMAWHTYPPGQTPSETFDCGRVVRHDAGSVEETRLGGVVRFEPCRKHKHGATPATRTAIQERQDDKAVIRLKQVSNAHHECG